MSWCRTFGHDRSRMLKWWDEIAWENCSAFVCLFMFTTYEKSLFCCPVTGVKMKRSFDARKICGSCSSMFSTTGDVVSIWNTLLLCWKPSRKSRVALPWTIYKHTHTYIDAHTQRDDSLQCFKPILLVTKSSETFVTKIKETPKNKYLQK